MTRISCIIPAWNEATRIGAVLSVALDHPMIDEVIVVDDASTDDTASVVGAFPAARLIRQPMNAGTTRAVATGVAAALASGVVSAGEATSATDEDHSNEFSRQSWARPTRGTSR